MATSFWFYSPIDDQTFTASLTAGFPGDPAISGNINVTEDGLCFGQIKADPDIAGWGVFAGFVFNTFSIIVCSFWFLWLPYARRKFSSDTKTLPKKENSDEDEQELTWQESLVLTLGDTNLVSALAAIISSMIKLTADPQYALYHIFLGRSLAFMAINGHNTGIYFIYSKFKRHHPISLRLRSFLSLETMGIWLAWSVIALQRFREWNTYEWPSFTPMCFNYSFNRVPWSFEFWFWWNMLVVPLGYPWALLLPFEWSESLHQAFEAVDDFTIGVMKGIFFGEFALVLRSTQKPLEIVLLYLFGTLKCSLGIIWLLFCIFVLPTTAMHPFSSLVGLAWDIYDVLTIKLGNKNAVVDSLQTSPTSPTPENPELQWGYGQIFPIVMLLMWVVAVLDATSARPKKKTVDLNLSDQTQGEGDESVKVPEQPDHRVLREGTLPRVPHAARVH